MGLVGHGSLGRVVSHVEVGVVIQLLQAGLHRSLSSGARQHRDNVVQSLSNVEPDVSHAVCGHADDGGQEETLSDLGSAGLSEHIYAEETGHPVQIVLVLGHRNHLRYDRLLGPLGAELLH